MLDPPDEDPASPASFFGADSRLAAARASACSTDRWNRSLCFVAGLGAGDRLNPAAHPTGRRPNLKRTRLGKTAKPSDGGPGPVYAFSGPLKLGRASLATRSPSLRSAVPPADPPFHRPTDPPVRRLSGDVAPFRPACIGEIESQVQSPARAARDAIAREMGSGLFVARRFAPSSGRCAPKPAHVRRDARREETRRETTASSGRAPRRGQGRQAGSLQLRISGVAKGRRNDPRSEAFFAVFGFRFDGEREATPRRRIGLRAKPPRGDSIRAPRPVGAVLPAAGCAANPPKRRPRSEFARNWAIGCARLGDAAPGRYGIGAACTT